MRKPEPAAATTVARPEANTVTATSNPVRIATRAVAGNIVKTCWNPRLINAPGGGVSGGKYPVTLDWSLFTAPPPGSSKARPPIAPDRRSRARYRNRGPVRRGGRNLDPKLSHIQRKLSEAPRPGR